MFFSLENKYNWERERLAFKVYNIAKTRILTYKIGASELALNELLKKEYGLELKPMCLKLLDNIKVISNNNNKYILKFIDPELNNIAGLITYGDSRVQGSRILQVAFMQL